MIDADSTEVEPMEVQCDVADRIVDAVYDGGSYQCTVCSSTQHDEAI